METLGPAGMYRGERAAQRRYPQPQPGPPLYDDVPPGAVALNRSGGIRPLVPLNGPAQQGEAPRFAGYDAHTRHNITQIFFGCQNVMIYAAEGHVELLLSMDPSGSWQPITPDAAEELGQRLLDAADRARDAGNRVLLKEEAKRAMEAQMNDSERSRP